MKIVFFGTPDFAVPSLDKIYNSAHEVAAVVTAPDKERGRGRKISHTAVKKYALENDIKTLQPEKMKDEQFINDLKEIDADLFVIVAFKILPPEVYKLPKLGSFNLHGSVLPKYRGAAPIQWAIIKGEKETGVTTFFLKDKVDTGNIIDTKRIKIHDDDNLGTIHDKLSVVGSDLVLETVNKIADGTVETAEQDDSIACPAPKINKDTCRINWEKPAIEIHNLIRGLSPYPAAFFELNGKKYKIYKSEISTEHSLKPGEILETKHNIFIGTGKNSLSILEIQPEGRKRMPADAFLRGYSLK